MPTPVPPPAPCTIAVYAPGSSVTMIADSSAFAGASPTAWTCAAFAAVPQSSLVAITCWSDERTRVSVGLARGLAMPAAASDGPAAVITTVFGNAPPTMKPPIITSLPVRTSMRVEMLASRGGSGGGAGAATPSACETVGAARCVASPAWLASIVHVPGAVKDTVDAATVQTADEAASIEKDTASPELAV